MIYADLHVHTIYSDGVHEINDVIRRVKAAGIQAVAVCDHDTVFHYDQVKKACEEQGIECIRGVEMSCYDSDVYKKVHVLGLWLNDHPTHVEELCANTLNCRDSYHRKLIQELNEKGLDITYEEAKQYAPYNIVFKMHLFMAIVAKYPEYNDMNKYRALFAGKTSRETDSQMGYIDVKEGIEAILKDGGIPVLAHPCEYNNYDEIEKYVGYGIKGIEISHFCMKEKDYPLTNEYAEKFHLLKTGGSDFHNIDLTSLGEFGLTREQFEALKERAGRK